MESTSRRQFIRMFGGALVTSFVAPAYAKTQAAMGMSKDGIVLDPTHFTSRGGWVLDTQFYQQTGGNYLMAHGLGKPVENATAELPSDLEAGDYYIFVRCKDWCPGDWDSPGQFQISVDGKTLPHTFGSSKKDWSWEKGGKLSLKKNSKVSLIDLTGFNGRVDSIYFSKTPDPKLPEKVQDVMAWKDLVSGRSNLTIEDHQYDVVIVGGGMTGCGAALAADSQGLKVALIQDRPILGGNASEEIRVHTLGIHGKGSDILKKIDTKHYPNGDAKAKLDQKKREQTLKESGVDVFASHQAIGIEKEGRRILSVDARHTDSGIIKRFKAPVFIDCSGDGMLGLWAGCEFRYGREANSEFNEKWDKYGDLWSPEKADNKVMGTSVLWGSKESKQASVFPDVPWTKPVAKDHEAHKGEWYWEYTDDKLHQIHDAERIRDHVLRAIFGSFANLKQHRKNARRELEWVAFVGGRRESRRIMGDYIYSMKDAAENVEFEDTVVEEKREIDTHYQRKEKGDKLDFLSKALFYKTGGLYYIPFRCFYAKDMDNLMMAGRCFSCTHIGLAGPRVMNTCGQMGIATGYAAVLCKKHNATPKEVGKKHIAELRKLIGY